MTTHDKITFAQPPSPLFSNTSDGLPSTQMIPETQLQSHQPQITNFRPPIPPKTTTAKPSTVNILINWTSMPIIRRKPSISTSSVTANFTKALYSNLSQPYTNSQRITMCASQLQRTIHSNYTPPLSIATQPPFSTTSNLPEQTHIPVPSFQP